MAVSLLIGSPVGALEGTANDLSLMERLLASRGFDRVVLFGREATRSGILRHCEALVEAASPDAPVVLYYSGHGGLAANPYYPKGSGSPQTAAPFIPFLVPFDMDLSGTEDFRGILEYELYDILERLTLRTANVTAILDCCHAAGMSRSPGFRPKAIEPWTSGLKAHLDRLKGIDALKNLGDRRHTGAVRLFATTADCQAYEYRSHGHGRVSLFTEVLCQTLDDESSGSLSWHALMKRVRDRVMHQRPNQRPEIAGPALRLAFKTTLDGAQRKSRFFYDSLWPGKSPSLRGGRLQGLEVGDIYGLSEPGSPPETPALGKVRVTQIQGGVSRVEILEKIGSGLLRAGLDALPLNRALPRLPVRTTRPTRQLSRAIAESVYVFETESEACQPLAQVAYGDNLYAITDRDGQALAPAEEHPNKTVRHLESLARAHHMLRLENGPDHGLLRERFSLRWGYVSEERPSPCPLAGTRLHVGDTLFIELDNRGKAPLYLHVFNIDLDKAICLLTASTPSGAIVYGDEQAVFGWDPGTGKRYWRLGWGRSGILDPETTPDEHLVAIVANQPVDLLSLQQPGFSRAAAGDPLSQKIRQIYHGTTRGAPEANLGYAVHHIHFSVSAQTRLQEVPL